MSKSGFNLFDGPAVAVPTAGVILFVVILIACQAWFRMALAILAMVLVIGATR